ncbi:MAG TPA: sulfurtransferase TusA family protein [Gammaproteobacteria bacterium]|nr:sulfurtransferase TusA family protein [Gammaproteobacteria bacterium]
MGLFGGKKDNASSPAGEAVTLDNGTSVTPTQLVDCLGDSCPRPQLMTKKAMSKMVSGEVLEVRIDNPTSMEAIPPMMPELQGTHLGTVKTDRYWRVIVQKN